MKVFSTTYGVEVFVNEGGQISITQEGQYGDDPDIVVIPPERVNDVIKALRQAKREALEG